MMLHDMAAMLLEGNANDWPALAGMIVAFGGIAGIVGAVIAGMIVEPIIQKAKDEIALKIEKVMQTMVSKEVFEVFATNDRAEHEDMKEQLRELAKNGNHR
jgi:hypothetical protein